MWLEAKQAKLGVIQLIHKSILVSTYHQSNMCWRPYGSLLFDCIYEVGHVAQLPCKITSHITHLLAEIRIYCYNMILHRITKQERWGIGYIVIVMPSEH